MPTPNPDPAVAAGQAIFEQPGQVQDAAISIIESCYAPTIEAAEQMAKMVGAIIHHSTVEPFGKMSGLADQRTRLKWVEELWGVRDQAATALAAWRALHPKEKRDG